ncbi:hypothetical protein D3C76_230030 [compost metagenome]|uniref:DUF4034 domain-containing protein n=1 Tax=Pseudomonas capeferrum TaxID=1495066 RepID=A0ABY7R933_9PSED|nr:DUF4034 domain-containing protein [Pseudomonas capeferrum]KEY86231.1 hypothetical protein PC358_20955 [Pseudomonas capeferrum]MCH7297729.1 DUF4034 domain-containing protein [Pseudomonas capeferrum]MUT49191.1 DUF4034 domain-containing protein [Pseudomonas sp. TDA1]WCI00086.1 DUF4034 domain-containing protein [Pseudomonas capeferrum]
MQTLTRTRQAIRELVQASAFVELNRYFDILEARWRQSPPGEFPAYLEAVEGHMLVDWDCQGDKALTQVLKAWIDACPKAYHPQVVMGLHCFSRACDIHDSANAEPLSAEQQLAAEQVCELGAAHLLRAMGRSAQPVAAAIGMLRLSAQFAEPGWLRELFDGQPARFSPSAHADVEVQEAAAPLLVKYGLLPLAQVPQTLPACLGKRAVHGREAAQHYWLQHALGAFPGCFEAIQAHAIYLLPRWGGSYAVIDGLAGGMLCEGWREEQRNALRWLAIEDQLELPHAGQVQSIAAWQQVFKGWSLRALRPRERATLLAWRGALRGCALQDYTGALRDFAVCVNLYPDLGFVPSIGQPFRSFVCLMLFHGMDDDQQAFRSAIERLCESGSHPAACALRAVGHAFGRWGFACSPEQARIWSQRAVKRQLGRQRPDFDVLEVPRLLWSANQQEAAYFLYERCADLSLPEAALSLHHLHRGALANTPGHYLDADAAEYWLLRAVQAGCKVAKYTLACRRMQSAEALSDRSAMLAVRRLLNDALGSAQTAAGARLQLGILLRQFGEPQEQAEAVDYLLGLVEHPDDWIAARASAELGLAWMQGHGTRKQSRFAAIEWINRAVALQPADNDIEHIQAEILNSHNRVKTLFTLCGAALFRGTLHASELPPKSGNPGEGRLQASA